MICPNCKSENDNDARFCEHCGTKLPSQVSTAENLSTIVGRKTGKKHRLHINRPMKFILWGIGVLGGILLLFFLISDIRNPHNRFDSVYGNAEMQIKYQMRIVSKQGKYGVVGGAWWREILPCKYDYIDFCDGIMLVELNGKWSFLNPQGEQIIPSVYDDCFANIAYPSFFMEGVAPVQVGDKWGFIDQRGNTVIPFQYDAARPFEEGLAATYIEGQGWGYINHAGENVIAFQFSGTEPFTDGLAIAALGNNHFFIDKTGKEAFPNTYYDKAASFYQGYADVSRNGKWGRINKRGDLVIPIQYDYIDAFSDGIARVRINDKWGYVDSAGSEITSIKYDLPGNFHENMAAVQINGKWGYINREGKEVIPFMYIIADSFDGGTARVHDGKRQFYIDKQGKEVDD